MYSILIYSYSYIYPFWCPLFLPPYFHVLVWNFSFCLMKYNISLHQYFNLKYHGKGLLSLIYKKGHLGCWNPVNVDLKLPIFILKMSLFCHHFLSSFCISGHLLTVGHFFIWIAIFICELIFGRVFFFFLFFPVGVLCLLR